MNSEAIMKEMLQAKDELDVFGILNKYDIGHFEGEQYLRTFHEANIHRLEVINKLEEGNLKARIEKLKQKHKHLADIDVDEFEHFYGQLLFNKLKEKQLYGYEPESTVITRCQGNRAEERKKRKAKELNIDLDTIENKYSNFGEDETDWEKLLRAYRCVKCEHLIECQCK